ncbi:hypothetical protein BDV09DRAFT_195517 [Aspergillus tetrazonus]
MGLTYDIEAIRHRQSACGAAGETSFISFPSYLDIGASTPSTVNQPVSAQTQYSYGAQPSPRRQIGLNPPLRFSADPLPPLESEAFGLADSGNGLVYNARGIVTAHLFFPLIVQVVPNAPGESYLFEPVAEDDVWQAEYGWNDTDGPLPQEGDVAFGWWADRGKLRKGKGTVVKTYNNVKAVWVEYYAGLTF